MQSLPILRNFASQKRQIPGFIGIDANPHGLTDRPRLAAQSQRSPSTPAELLMALHKQHAKRI